MIAFSENEVREALLPHGLLDAHAYFMANNPSAHLPYHNLYHANTVILHCHDGAMEMGLGRKETRSLLLGAMFHDFAHSGGNRPDDENIAAAVSGLESWCRKSGAPPGLLEGARRIVRITRFPHLDRPASLAEEIIRDADLMQIYAPEWQKQILGGLRRELCISQGREIGIIEMIALQLKFMEGVNWYTSWAKRKAEAKWESLIGEIRLIGESLCPVSG